MKGFLDGLNPEQGEAVLHSGSPLLILAGAGSGKTRVITMKIAYLVGELGYDPESILAVTFTNKAAREMKERACAVEPRAERVMIRTFHSFGSWFLRRNAHALGLDPNFTIYDDTDSEKLLSGALKTESAATVARLARAISRAKDYLLAPDSGGLSEITHDPEFPRVYEEYEKAKKRTGNVDFGDLIKYPRDILIRDPAIRDRTHQRFRVLLVDEYQDSNVAQFELLKALTGTESYLCVVGDDDQSIYKFRGAEIRNILTFGESFPGTKIIKLERNYRSQGLILRCASAVVENNLGRLGKTLIPVKPDGRKPVLVSLETQEEEAQFCANVIKSHRKKGGSYADIAILYRTNAQSLTFESDFLRRGIPFRVVGALRFYEREEVKDALSFLAFVANPKDEVAFERIVNKPTRGLGETGREAIRERAIMDGTDLLDAMIACQPFLSRKAREGAREFLSLVQSIRKDLLEPNPASGGLGGAVERVVKESGLLEYHKAKDEIQGSQKEGNLYELVNAAAQYPAGLDGLVQFLETVELDRSMSEADTAQDSVTLITMHNTKGLEFKVVIVTGLELGIFPREDDSEDEVEEQRRLFYVAMTRAMDELWFTWARCRRIRGRTDFMAPSPFLRELPSECVEGFGPGGTGTPGTGTTFTRGERVYHDDYGPGNVTDAKMGQDGLEVVFVRFETGQAMRFIPRFAKKLERIRD